jgi:anti-anti-sigma factor
MGTVSPSDPRSKASSRTIVLDVHRALDRAGAPELCSEIDAAATEAQRIVVDLRGVTGCDSSGVRALVEAAREATIRMRHLVVAVTANSPLDRLLTLTGAREFLRVDETRDAGASGASRRRAVFIGS